jgi:hypothetical protein
MLVIHETLKDANGLLTTSCEGSNKSAAMIIVAVWRIPALCGTDLQ